MQRVLRFGKDGDITHILACVINGQGQYITKVDHDIFMSLGADDVWKYYSGIPQDVLKDDISDIITGEVSIDVMRFRLLHRHSEFSGDVIEKNG
tara:strand:- start:30 stop:311 length:282 start_codon:yes stop_codon:yes gene_type:complete